MNAAATTPVPATASAAKSIEITASAAEEIARQMAIFMMA